MTQGKQIAIIGAGPAALMAAETLAQAGYAVDVYDRMGSPARKLLIAGRGGLNLTHSEPLETFLTLYGAAADWLAPSIQAFPPDALRAWCDGLGGESFIGSSGRIFPKRMKAVGLLRAWLKRLETLGVQYHPHYTWLGWQGKALHFITPMGEEIVAADATLLALGGASWPRLGSRGEWVDVLRNQGVEVAPLQPSNMGFTMAWSEFFRTRFAGQPLKNIAVTHAGITRQGEAMITDHGIEGGVIYALSAPIRDAITRDGSTSITIDLRPGMAMDALRQKLSARGGKSLSSFLKSAGFSPIAIALLHETQLQHAKDLASSLKALKLTLTGNSGIARAISTAGGVKQEAVDADFMLRSKAGVFVAGEMLDWEAPTGGYLLQACFSTGVAAAEGIMQYLGAAGSEA